MNNIQQWFRREGLTRPQHSRLLAGVVLGHSPNPRTIRPGRR